MLNLGLGLDSDGLAESRGDGALLLNYRDDGGTLTDAQDLAVLAGIDNDITSAKGVNVGHKKVGEVGRTVTAPVFG